MPSSHATICCGRCRVPRSKASPWVPLDVVLATPGHSVLSQYEVDLTNGIAQPSVEASTAEDRTVTWNVSTNNAHHDAYVYARKRSATPSSAVVVAVQLRHGNPKTAAELEPQALRKKPMKNEDKSQVVELVDCLLYVHQRNMRVPDAKDQPNLHKLNEAGGFAVVDGSRIARDSSIFAMAPFTQVPGAHCAN